MSVLISLHFVFVLQGQDGLPGLFGQKGERGLQGVPGFPGTYNVKVYDFTCVCLHEF